MLDTTYRFNERIGEVVNGFMQQHPYQLKKPLNSLKKVIKSRWLPYRKNI